MIDVSGLIDDFPQVSVTLRTYNATTVDVLGETTATYADTVRDVVVHPSGRKTIERLFGRDYGPQAQLFYSTAALRTVGATRPQRILYAGNWYELVEEADYLDLGGICFAVGRRVES